jgi:hypothetical protein
VNRLRLVLRCAWNRRTLTYAFGNLCDDVRKNVARNAVRRAFKTWAKAGVGLSFHQAEVDNNDDGNAKPDTLSNGGKRQIQTIAWWEVSLLTRTSLLGAQSSWAVSRYRFTSITRNALGLMEAQADSTSRPAPFTKSVTCWVCCIPM